MAGFTPVNVAGNYLAGRRNAQDEQFADTRNVLAQQHVQQNQQAMQDQQAGAQAEQQKAMALRLMQAAQYGVKNPQPKAFIEQNFPELVQAAGPQWATMDDEGVRAELQNVIGKFGPQAGVGPQPEKGTSGAMYKIVDPETGNITYETAEGARGKNAYTYTPPVKASAGEKRPAPPRGFRYKGDGSVEPIPGGPNDPNSPNKPTQQSKPATEGDKRARVMYFSMRNAEKQLENVTAYDTSDLGQAILGKIPGGRVAQSDEFKRYEAGGLRWAANLLYLKSGATATPDEIRSTWLQFFPQPGDGASVKAQKDEARQQEMFAINDTYKFEAAPTPATQPTTATPPATGWSIKPL